MNLRQLEAFALVVEFGSLTRAARTADIAQSLLSRQIAQLESEWGDRLFERTGRGVLLSDFGRRVQPEIQLLLDQARRLELTAKEAAGTLAGTVHIGMFPSVARQLLPLLFADIQVRAPAVRLQVIEGFSGSLDEQLASGRLDITVMNRYGSIAARGEDVLGHAETFLVGRPGDPRLAEKTVSLRALDGVSLVLPPMPNGLRSILEQQAKRQGLTLRVVLEVDTLVAMKNIAASGEAFTMLPLIAVEEDIGQGTLAAARMVRPAIKRIITLGLTQQRPLSKAARLVASRLRELTGRLLA
jgi:LysR family nitrogen assimilation transcriptional regulator